MPCDISIDRFVCASGWQGMSNNGSNDNVKTKRIIIVFTLNKLHVWVMMLMMDYGVGFAGLFVPFSGADLNVSSHGIRWEFVFVVC